MSISDVATQYYIRKMKIWQNSISNRKIRIKIYKKCSKKHLLLKKEYCILGDISRLRKMALYILVLKEE